MKYLIALSISLLSVSAFSATVGETINEVENTYNVECRKVSKINRLCLGLGVDESSAVTTPCWYSLRYICENQTDIVDINLKVRETYNVSAGKRQANVTKISISK